MSRSVCSETWEKYKLGTLQILSTLCLSPHIYAYIYSFNLATMESNKYMMIVVYSGLLDVIEMCIKSLCITLILLVLQYLP